MYYNKLRDDHKFCSEWAFFRAWNVHSFTLPRIVTFHCSFISNWRIHGKLGPSTNRIHTYYNIRDSHIPFNKHINTNANRKTNKKKTFLLFFSIFLHFFFFFPFVSPPLSCFSQPIRLTLLCQDSVRLMRCSLFSFGAHMASLSLIPTATGSFSNDKHTK